MDKAAQEAQLKNAIKRIAMIRDWCGISGLVNVRSDAQKAIDEISSVIYKLQKDQQNDQR